MGHQEEINETKLYRVYDEMGCEDILLTNDLSKAHSAAYNYQCILINNLTNKIIKDYSDF